MKKHPGFTVVKTPAMKLKDVLKVKVMLESPTIRPEETYRQTLLNEMNLIATHKRPSKVHHHKRLNKLYNTIEYRPARMSQSPSEAHTASF